VSQPAISRQISILEKELGTKLFIRNNQKTELTESGKLYFDLFGKYKAEFLNTKLIASQIDGRSKNIIRIGFLEGWDLTGIVPEMIKRYKDRYPDSEVIINCCGVKEITTSLLTDSMDIAVTMKNSVEKHLGLEANDVAEIGKILIFSAKNKHDGKEDLSLADFKDETFLAPWEIVDKMIIEATATYTRPYGFIPDIRFLKNHESTITCVRNDMGVMIADEWVWAKNAEDLRWIPIHSTDTIATVRMKHKETEPIIFMEQLLGDIISKM
jgi:DNA-binding transcriptional LysR family regulator